MSFGKGLIGEGRRGYKSNKDSAFLYCSEYICIIFQTSNAAPNYYIFKEWKLYVRLNHCIVLFLFSSCDSSRKQSRLFFATEKEIFEKKKTRKGEDAGY